MLPLKPPPLLTLPFSGSQSSPQGQNNSIAWRSSPGVTDQVSKLLPLLRAIQTESMVMSQQNPIGSLPVDMAT